MRSNNLGAKSEAISAWAQQHLPIVLQLGGQHFGGARGPLRDVLPYAHLRRGMTVRLPLLSGCNAIELTGCPDEQVSSKAFVSTVPSSQQHGKAQAPQLRQASILRAKLSRELDKEEAEWRARPRRGGTEVRPSALPDSSVLTIPSVPEPEVRLVCGHHESPRATNLCDEVANATERSASAACDNVHDDVLDGWEPRHGMGPSTIADAEDAMNLDFALADRNSTAEQCWTPGFEFQIVDVLAAAEERLSAMSKRPQGASTDAAYRALTDADPAHGLALRHIVDETLTTRHKHGHVARRSRAQTACAQQNPVANNCGRSSCPPACQPGTSAGSDANNAGVKDAATKYSDHSTDTPAVGDPALPGAAGEADGPTMSPTARADPPSSTTLVPATSKVSSRRQADSSTWKLADDTGETNWHAPLVTDGTTAPRLRSPPSNSNRKLIRRVHSKPRGASFRTPRSGRCRLPSTVVIDASGPRAPEKNRGDTAKHMGENTSEPAVVIQPSAKPEHKRPHRGRRKQRTMLSGQRYVGAAQPSGSSAAGGESCTSKSPTPSTHSHSAEARPEPKLLPATSPMRRARAQHADGFLPAFARAVEQVDPGPFKAPHTSTPVQPRACAADTSHPTTNEVQSRQTQPRPDSASSTRSGERRGWKQFFAQSAGTWGLHPSTAQARTSPAPPSRQRPNRTRGQRLRWLRQPGVAQLQKHAAVRKAEKVQA